MAPPSADMADVEGEEEVIPNGLAISAGYVNLSENPTGLHDDAVGNGGVGGAVDEDAGSNGAVQTGRPRSQGTVVNINGIEMTVYGNVQGLEFLSLGNSTGREIDVDAVDEEEEEEEARRRLDAERAIREAEEADIARRSAPLPAEQCQTIRNAMRGITLDFRPDWAGSIPEQEWMSRVLESGGSARGSTPGDGRNSSF